MVGPASSRPFVLDAYALMAFFLVEAGQPRVRQLLETAQSGEAELWFNTVNMAEVLYKLIRRGGALAQNAQTALVDELPIRLAVPDVELTVRTAELKAIHPISIADCYAAALTERLDATLVTGDRDFQRFEGNLRIEWLPPNR